MALYDWEYKDWKIEIGTGTPDPLNVDKWPVLEWVKRPTRKESGIFPKKLTLKIIDTDGPNGYVWERIFTESLIAELTLDSNLYFKGLILSESTPRPIGEDAFSTSLTVGDGIEALTGTFIDEGFYTYTEFLRECLDQTGLDLDIHLYTDWDEDNATGDLPDNNRIRVPRSTHRQALNDFCNDFGYQIYQSQGVWVVRSLAYFSQDSITRWVITDSSASSSVVTTFEALPEIYKTSELDLFRGLGSARSVFEWRAREGGIENPEFDGSNEGWDESGTIAGPGEITDESGVLTQETESLIGTFDRLRLFVRVKIDYEVLDTSTTARFLQVIFTHFDGVKYYLQNNGQFTTSETTITRSVETPPIADEDLFVEIDEQLTPSSSGLPLVFGGSVTLRLLYDSDGGNYNGFEFIEATVEPDIRSRRYERTEVTSQTNTDLTVGDVSLSRYQNIRNQYQGFDLEYNDGAWKASLEFGGDSFGEKRSEDELKVRNKNMRVLYSEGDFAGYSGSEKLYSYDGDRYIVAHERIEIGLDDVHLFLIEHEVTSETITTSEVIS